MRALAHFVCPLVLSLCFSGCTPGTYIRLYNMTGQVITVTTDMETLTIAPDTSADVPTLYARGEQLNIRTSTKSWDYSLRSLLPPPAFRRHSVMVIREYARIDRRGYIHMLLPPRSDGDAPGETRQPSGFPVAPRKT
jgi:hypothetical protein